MAKIPLIPNKNPVANRNCQMSWQSRLRTTIKKKIRDESLGFIEVQ